MLLLCLRCDDVQWSAHLGGALTYELRYTYFYSTLSDEVSPKQIKISNNFVKLIIFIG
jgi:hypothetical protein